MGERGATETEVAVSAKSDKPGDGLVAHLPTRETDGHDEARVIELGRSRRMEETGERQEHWEEVELVLEMWEKVAHAWDNDTLMRLARYARLEAETEKELERRAR